MPRAIAVMSPMRALNAFSICSTPPTLPLHAELKILFPFAISPPPSKRCKVLGQSRTTITSRNQSIRISGYHTRILDIYTRLLEFGAYVFVCHVTEPPHRRPRARWDGVHRWGQHPGCRVPYGGGPRPGRRGPARHSHRRHRPRHGAACAGRRGRDGGGESTLLF